MNSRTGMLLVAVTALTSSSLFASGKSADARILRSTDQSIQIEFIPQYFPAKLVAFNEQQFAEYDFAGSSNLARHGETGVPDLKYKIITLGFQSIQGNVVQVITADYEDIPNVVLKPMPAFQVKDEIVVIKDISPNREKYAISEFLPGKVAEIPYVEQVRSMLIGNLNVFPLQYNPATKTLRRYSRIVIEVSFAAATAARIQSNDDELFGDILLNRNEAKTWKFGSTRTLNKLTTGQPSVLAEGNWYRIPISEEGMYRLDANWFSSNNINLAGVDPRKIKIYGNGGEELSESLRRPRPVDLVENAIYVEGEADGVFNPGDFVLFYGKSVQGVRYDSTARTLRHYIHHYSRVNYYWLTIATTTGKRMATQQSVVASPTLVPDWFTDIAWVEPDTVNIYRSGKSWLSFTINPNASQARALSLFGVVPNEERIYRYQVVASTTNYLSSSFEVFENGAQISPNGGHQIYGAGVNEGSFETRGSFPLNGTTSQLSFRYSVSEAAAVGYLDWVEVVYPRRFEAVNNFLRFRSLDTDATIEYRLTGFTGAVAIYNVTNFADVKRIVDVTGSMRAIERAGHVSEYAAVAASAFKTPGNAVKIDTQNLRGIATQYDFIIVTSQEFMAAANRLEQHRENPLYGGLNTLVVDVNKIYNEFSGGVPDITAIRDFLKYAYDNWTPANPPDFVCFFGQASYDYKGIAGKSSYVPTWQSDDSYNEIQSTATDDFFVRFGDPLSFERSRPWMISGRLNARSAREAEIQVDKLIAYDTQSARDPWKLRIMYVADDGWSPEYNDGADHTRGAETLASFYTPEVFDKKKIYTEEYPLVQGGQGRRRPEAYQAIIDGINRGALIVNYTGHGNPTVWAHESIFSVQTSIPQLVNANKLCVFFGATCNFSQFDDFNRSTGSEILLNKIGGGAIGVVSASRKVYSNDNQRLNNGIYQAMFVEDAGRVIVERVATAIYRYKQTSNDNNDEKYFLLGDPTMRLQFPSSSISIDSVNGFAVDASSARIQLRSLARVTVKGTIRNQSNEIDSTVSGKTVLVVNDATRDVPIPTIAYHYAATGSIVYQGENSVSRGKFSATFVVPKDIAYADSTTSARLVAYFTSAQAEGAGYTRKIWVGGTDATALRDTAGPSIRILLGNTYEESLSFRPGDMVNEKAKLFVDLLDSNGVNTSTSGVGHRIEAWINASAQSIDLTEFYSSKLDNYQAGIVSYPFLDLPKGRNSIKVRAWDTFNNANNAESYFDVLSSEQLSIVNVMNFPNPLTKNTVFTFRHNQNVPVDATVKVYTVAGRLVRTLDVYAAGESFVSIPWDGRDRDGDVLANGVYLYKVLVRTVDGRFSSESLGKLAVAK